MIKFENYFNFNKYSKIKESIIKISFTLPTITFFVSKNSTFLMF